MQARKDPLSDIPQSIRDDYAEQKGKDAMQLLLDNGIKHYREADAKIKQLRCAKAALSKKNPMRAELDAKIVAIQNATSVINHLWASKGE